MRFTYICPWFLVSSLTCLSLTSFKSVKAQIIPDGTLGAESSVVTSDQILNGIPSDRIDGGAIRGGNLFHSFQEFNIDSGRGAYFTNPSGIENILTRVTGNNRSDILGTLGVLGNANLFFLNPNGIIFGANARLDVNGSFVGTTANSIGFGNQGFFSATNPTNNTPLLTVNPSALFFNQIAAAIQYNSVAPTEQNPAETEVTGLRVPNGESLLLVGGDINIDGGSLRAYEGRVELAAIQANGVVGLNVAENTFTLSVPQDTPRANVSLSGGAEIKVRASDGGSIAINAQNLSLAERSVLLAGIDLGLGNQQSIAGDIVINATGETQLSGNSFIANTVARDGEGIAGNINVTTGALTLGSGAQLGTATFGRGDAGNVIIDVRGNVSFDGTFSGAFTNVLRGGDGKGGNVEIRAGSLSLTNGSRLIATTFGRGDAGNVIIDVRGNVSFDNSGVFTNVLKGAVGKGGNVEIRAGSLSLTNLSGFNAGTQGQGDAGNVIIDVGGDVSFDNSGVFSSVIFFGGIGKGGNVEIKARSLSLTNGSLLSARTQGQGDAGNVIIDVRGDVSFDNSYVSSEVNFFSVNLPGANFFDGVVKGGNIEITADSLSLTNGARLAAETLGQGDAGSIEIDAPNFVSVSGTSSITGRSSGLFTSTLSDFGIGGDITVNTTNLLVSDGAVLDAQTTNNRNGGNINIITSETFSLTNSARLITSTSGRGEGDAGNVTINTPKLKIQEGAQISASTSSRGQGGNITVTAPELVTIGDNSQLSVEASGAGRAGNVTFNTDLLTVEKQASVSATSTATATTSEQGGSIDLNANRINLFGKVGIFAETQGDVPAGSLSLQPYNNGQSLDVNFAEGASISASTSAGGNGGDLIIIAPEAINISGQGTLAVETTGTGNAGNIEISTQKLTLSDGVQISASSSSSGKGGSLTVNASKSALLQNQSRLLTESSGAGVAGNLTINTPQFTIQDRSEVSASTSGGAGGTIKVTANTFDARNSGKLLTTTSGESNAGSITLEVSENITLAGTGTGIFASTESGSTGKGGSIIIDPRTFIIRDGATISANSQGESIGGDIELAAGSLTLDNGKISAETRSNTGGNITLNLQDLLLLRNGSKISTNAGTELAGGNGGNITIDGKFIVAIPNEDSDISANAFSGNGGNIQINSQGIFGIESRPEPTQKSDITASSELGVSGVININTPDNSSIQNSFSQLSPNVIDTNALIANSCISRGTKRQENSFTITGSGALRNSPGDVLISAYTTGEVRNVEPTSRLWKKGDPIIEPQGLYRLPDGRLLLSRACV